MELCGSNLLCFLSLTYHAVASMGEEVSLLGRNIRQSLVPLVFE